MQISPAGCFSRVLKNVFNTLLIGPRMAQRNHAQFYVLDLGERSENHTQCLS